MNIIYKFLNILFLIVLFSVLDGTPLKNTSNYFSVAAIFISFFFIDKKLFLKKNDYYYFFRLFLFLFFILLVSSIIASKIAFHQSIIDSCTAHLDFFELFILLFFTFIFTLKKIDVKYFQKVIICFILLEVILQIIFRNAEKAALAAPGQYALNAGRLPKNFIRFGVFYFFALFLREGKSRYGFIALFLLLLPNLLIDFQRGYFVIASFILLFCFLFIKKRTKSLNVFLVGGFLGILLLLVIFTFFSSNSIITKVTAKYSAVISSITKGKSSDVSVNYRIVEINIAKKHIEKNPFIGVGKMKSESVEKYIGRNYYPSDIGVMGIMGTYGILGMLLYIFLLIMAIKHFIKIYRRSKVYSPFTLGLVAYLLYLTIESLQTANIILHPAFFGFIFIFLLYSRNSDEGGFNDEDNDKAYLYNNDLKIRYVEQ